MTDHAERAPGTPTTEQRRLNPFFQVPGRWRQTEEWHACRWCDKTVVQSLGMSEVHVYPHGEYHELSMSCWCRPYRDAKDPRLIIHRKAERA